MVWCGVVWCGLWCAAVRNRDGIDRTCTCTCCACALCMCMTCVAPGGSANLQTLRVAPSRGGLQPFGWKRGSATVKLAKSWIKSKKFGVQQFRSESISPLFCHFNHTNQIPVSCIDLFNQRASVLLEYPGAFFCEWVACPSPD